MKRQLVVNVLPAVIGWGIVYIVLVKVRMERGFAVMFASLTNAVLWSFLHRMYPETPK